MSMSFTSCFLLFANEAETEVEERNTIENAIKTNNRLYLCIKVLFLLSVSSNYFILFFLFIVCRLCTCTVSEVASR